jgi:hypothetical protein
MITSIANIFVYILEKKWLHIHKPLYYKRFIDDVFIIISRLNYLFVIESLKNAFGSLKLNLVIDKSVDFLDLSISFDFITGHLIFKVYFKSTKTFSYLLTSSNHPDFIFKNIPVSLFLRIRRICSKTEDYIYFSLLLSKYLVSRGYDLKYINKIFTMVLNLKRNDLLRYKEKNNSKRNDLIYFGVKFNNGISNLNDIVRKSFNKFIEKEERFNVLKIRNINRMNWNLSALFIHGFKYEKSFKNFFVKCKNIYCKTCFYFNNDYYIKLNDNYLLPILDNSSCNSMYCIYIIKCILCNSFYIGQTVDIVSRLYTHINDIKKFKMYITDKCVAIHFNLKNHNYLRDLSIYIIKKDVTPLNKRLMFESFFLNLFAELKVNVFNDYKLPPLNAYNQNLLLDTID